MVVIEPPGAIDPLFGFAKIVKSAGRPGEGLDIGVDDGVGLGEGVGLEVGVGVNEGIGVDIGVGVGLDT